MIPFGFTKEDIERWKDQGFLLSGTKETAVVILHGWSAFPRQVKALANFINEKGYLVHAPLLSGHGTTPDDLVEAKESDWINDTKRAIKKVKSEKGIKKVVLIGISLGGNISLLVSQEVTVDGIVLLGTPIHFKNHLGAWIGSFFVPFFKKYLKKNYPKSIQRDFDFFNTTSYQYYPTICVREVLRSARHCAFSLRRVTAPLLILQTSKDYVVAKYSPWVIYNSVSSKVKKLQWIKLQNEDHVFIQDEMKDYFDTILNFVEQISAQDQIDAKQ
ncbi:alpha/beta fold hydrolase [bacterium]|jgi:carboxylesterase|nr:alpha/beta fold hydrolase [bacterium]MBT7038174.1 alpha/beta fold hydrolase [bacterium]MBT7431615.1 alpha/beta fold hydrolase [bacterium]